MQQAVEAGMSIQEVAEQTFDAIREDRFCILTHPDWNPAVQQRIEDLLKT
jgi:hypothetical protein